MSDPIEGTRRIQLQGRDATEVTLGSLVATVEEGSDRGRSATLRGPSLRIGTDPGNDLVLTDPQASRRHAVVTRGPAGIAVEDLGSTNGTWVGAVRLQAGAVEDGAVVRIGSSRVRLRIQTDRMLVFPDPEESGFAGLVGRSSPMQEVFALVRQLARTDLPVAVTGETGTGKELVARALHDAGPRAGKPFLVVDCGAILPELLRSELFGHEKGSFTGADRQHRGVLESAEGGTVFLDEVGELPLAVQPQLLRALETRQVTRLGSTRPVPVEFRIVSATNRDLRAASGAGTFRPDLYYRLSGVTLQLPALRDRPGDLEPLARHFLEAGAARNGFPPPRLEAGAMQVLAGYRWPGNLRELKNMMDQLAVLAPGAAIGAEQVKRALPAAAVGVDREGSRAAGVAPSSAPPSLAVAERETLLRALAETGGNRKAAAALLGISRTTLLKKLREYGLDAGPPP